MLPLSPLLCSSWPSFSYMSNMTIWESNFSPHVFRPQPLTSLITSISGVYSVINSKIYIMDWFLKSLYHYHYKRHSYHYAPNWRKNDIKGSIIQPRVYLTVIIVYHRSIWSFTFFPQRTHIGVSPTANEITESVTPTTHQFRHMH